MITASELKTTGLSEAIDGAHIRSRAWSLASSYRYCEQVARSHYENFPVGSLLVPAALRKHFYSIYAFARTADDFADEGYGGDCGEQERIALLAEWREMLRQAIAGRATHPVFIALAHTQAQFNLPITLFEDLLSAFTQDVTTRRYDTFDQLLDYCRRSANPVGRLILMLFGHLDEELHRRSDDICTALQLTNHWQDVSVDIDKDRIYLPAEDLARFGLSESDIKQKAAGEAFGRLMEFEAARARALFVRGKPLCLAVGGRLGVELRVIWLAGWRVLDRIEENGYDVFSRRPVINRADKIKLFTSAMRKGAFRHS